MIYKKIHTRAFTLVELVIVIVLLGIVSFYAVPRFVDVLDFERAGFYQEVVSATRYANRLAVGSGCPVRIRFQSNGYILKQPRDSCSDSDFTEISDSHPVSSNLDSGVTIKIDSDDNNSINATFTALGRCRDCNGDLTITIGGTEMTIFQETGYVNATS